MNVARRPAGSPRRAQRLKAESVRPPHRAAWWSHPAWWSALLALLLYLPGLGHGFVRDDHTLIEQNVFLRRDGWLGQLLVSDFWGSSGGSSGLWRPLTLLSYWIDGRVSGWNPAWFHAVNVLAHAATSALVATLALAATASVPAALVAGLWFASMPAHAESVAWVAGRTDVLCALFFLAALMLDRRARRAGRRWTGWLSLAALAAALASKEAAAPFVAVLLVAELAEPRPWRDRLAWLAPALGVTLVYLALHGHFAGALEASPADAALTARRTWSGWTMLAGDLGFLLPWGVHSPEMQLALPASATAPAVLLGVALHLGFLAAIAVAIRRHAANRGIALAVLWTTLLPAIAIAVTRGHVAYAERLIYLASAGAAGLVALATANARRVPRLVTLGAGALLVILSTGATTRLVPTWKSDATMYEAMVVAQPANAKARVGHAESLLDQGREAEALAELSRAESLDSTLAEVQVSRAIVHLRHEEWVPALERARRAIASEPRRLEARMAEAMALFRLGRRDEARARLEGVLRDHPDEPGAEALLGQTLLETNRPADAIPHLERAAHWNESDPALWFALGRARLAAGNAAEARGDFERTVRLAPGAIDAWLALARACAASGDAGARDAALARAAALPEAADGRVDALRRELSAH